MSKKKKKTPAQTPVSPGQEAPAQAETDVSQENVAPVVEVKRGSETDDAVLNLMDLDFENQAAQEAAGEEAPVYGVWGGILKLLHKFDKYKKHHTVNKKKYLWFLVLTGWCGGHRYYEHRWIVAVIYSALFWSGIPLAMCVLDAMAVIPMKADENGDIVL